MSLGFAAPRTSISIARSDNVVGRSGARTGLVVSTGATGKSVVDFVNGVQKVGTDGQVDW